MPNFYRLMRKDDSDNSFEFTSEIVEIIDKANDYQSAEKVLEGIKDFTQRIFFMITISK